MTLAPGQPVIGYCLMQAVTLLGQSCLPFNVTHGLVSQNNLKLPKIESPCFRELPKKLLTREQSSILETATE